MRCTEPRCDAPTVGRGLCKKHYERARRAGLIPQRTPSFCSVDDCDRRTAARGLCDLHYRRLLHAGTTEGRTAESRFWRFVDKGKRGECWNWTGNVRGSRPYGYFKVDGASVGAHRFAYELLVGPIPDGLTIDHLCKNRLCVNPAHLEAVTLQENILRGNNMAARYARRTHCNAGHPFSGDNLYARADGGRGCRACARQRKRRP